jgi:hypothetical protein
LRSTSRHVVFSGFEHWRGLISLLDESQKGPTGGNVRPHVICSISLSQKELHWRCQTFMMAENARSMGLQLLNSIFFALCTLK